MSESENTAPEEDAAGSAEPQPCMPCHGSGRVISNLGGTPSTVICPWCRGGGVRLLDADAQEYQREHADATR